MRLSDGIKSFQLGLAVLIQYRRVTDTQPARHVAVARTALCYRVAQVKTRMVGLPGGQRSFKIGLDVYAEYQHVTDRRTPPMAKTALSNLKL